MLGLRKRKFVEENPEGDESSISGDLKRVRISTTAGELRLQRDIEELRGFSGVSISQGDRPNCVVIEFDPISVTQLSVQTNCIPSRFLISVPRYYPHYAPQVQCLETRFAYSSPHITGDGVVHHAEFDNNWTPIKSLHNVVVALHEIRLYYHTQQSPNLHTDHILSPVAAHNNGVLLSPSRFQPQQQGGDFTLATPRGIESIQHGQTPIHQSNQSQLHSDQHCHSLFYDGEVENAETEDSAMITDDN